MNFAAYACLDNDELTLERWWPAPPTTDERSIIFALETTSHHNSFRVGYPENGTPPWGTVIPRENRGKLPAYVISF